jgi:magnesium transporter
MTSSTPFTKTNDNLWVHAEAPDEHEIKLLCSQYGLTERFVRDALDQDEIPRVETRGAYTYVITRFAYKATENSIKTAPILFAINHQRLVTVSLQKLPSLSEVLPEDASDGDGGDPVHLMLLILLKIDADYDWFIHESSKQIRHLLERIGSRQVGTRSFLRFVRIEDDMNDFISSLIPTNVTLQHLVNDSKQPAFATHHDLVNTVMLNNKQSIQTCESNLKSLASIRRTYTLINSSRLDRTIKILTMVSVFISIPTMFFSMYGMNIGLPFAQNPRMFTALMVVCLVIVLTAYAVGRKKRIF